jgi:hypothetical protein
MDMNDTVIGNNIYSSRLLLPFTHGVHAHALEYAVLLAKNRHATLVPCSLIHLPQTARGVRLESIQQSKDFQALVQSKASKHGVVVASQEIFTSDVIDSIHRITRELNCNGIILFVCDGEGVLLSTNEVKHILTLVPGQHHVIRLQRNASRLSLNPFKRVARMLPGHPKEQMISGTSFS